MRIKNLFQFTVGMLAIVSSKGTIAADQKNSTQLQISALDGDPCNVDGSIYNDCQTKTEGLSHSQFVYCMEKISDYNARDGDQCCPDPDPAKQYYDCQPTTDEDKRALYIAATLGPFAAVLGCIAMVCCCKNRTRLKEYVTLRLFYENNAEKVRVNQTTTPLISDPQINSA